VRFPSPQLRILGKIATKDFSSRDTLTPWPSERRNLCITSSTMKTHPTDENWYKYDPIFQLYRSTRPLLGHSTCPSACTTTRQLSKPEFHLSTTITIRVEMAPLMTESRADYQHTSILTHSNWTTTTIWQQTPDFVLQQPQKNCDCQFHRVGMFSNTAMFLPN